MSGSEFQEVEKIFFGALARGDESLGRYLERSCRGKPELRERIRRMVLAHESTEGGALRTPAPIELLTPSTLEPGTTIGDCRVVRLVGQGGVGMVYEAKERTSGRRVALKLLSVGFTDPSLVSRFEREAEALARLDHPGIAEIYGADTIDLGSGLQPYLVMELIDGRSLRDHLAENELALPDKLVLLERISGAVHHAHDRGVVHRDLKPENILIDRAGNPHIVDFGIAKIAVEEGPTPPALTRTGDLLFTIAYAAPEQVAGEFGPTDVRTDIYALGVLAYETLANTRPYEVDLSSPNGIDTITERALDVEPLVSAGVGDKIRAIVTKALHKRREERYESAAQLRDALEQARSNPSSQAPGGIAGRFAWSVAGVTIAALLLAALWLVARLR